MLLTEVKKTSTSEIIGKMLNDVRFSLIPDLQAGDLQRPVWVELRHS